MFEKMPIIILGVNHSGTRVLVDILSCLGSDGGDNNNKWKESETFIKAHYLLLNCKDTKDWNRRIFNTRFYKFGPPAYDATKVQEFLKQEVPIYFPNYCDCPWHWKCPVSALFLDFWLKQYPNAYYLHIVRNKYDVAYSLLKRKQFFSLKRALEFYDIAENRIRRIREKSNRYLMINYHTLEDDIFNIVNFIPFLSREIETALKLIKRKNRRFYWENRLSYKANLWNMCNVLRLDCVEFVEKIISKIK